MTSGRFLSRNAVDTISFREYYQLNFKGGCIHAFYNDAHDGYVHDDV